MKILINLKNLLISPRFQSFYWRTGGMAVISFLNLISENIAEVGLPVWAVALVGLLLGEITKGITNYLNNKPMGFAPKKYD